MAARDPERTEATLQADIHLFLRTAPFELDRDDVEVVLESPTDKRHRIDIEVGGCVIEVKRNLRSGGVRSKAIEQLTGYVRSRAQDTGQRYVGVLTDGAEWLLYHLDEQGKLTEISSLQINQSAPDAEQLVLWLEGVLGTATVQPTPHEIDRRLGAQSSAYALDKASLAALYKAHGGQSTVVLKRALWAKLLTTALGTNFSDTDDLFIEHTLLVVIADIIAHGVLGYDLKSSLLNPATILSGRFFEQAQISGVIESDFFDWVVEVPGGEAFVRTLAKRLARFAWADVEHDVMKVLYESVITPQTRHRLGEYYTPDWLAEHMVDHLINDPLHQRVLDPGCGSGTFLFHAVRRYLGAANDHNVPGSQALSGVTDHVLGMDIHPVAVTLARVTYLLALGTERVQASDRPPLSIPVYLGDSIQWEQRDDLLSASGLSISTASGLFEYADALRLPDSLLADASRFDQIVRELADKAARRAAGSNPPTLTALFRRFAIAPVDQPMVSETFRVLCSLHDQGRDHIWGYYVRNIARPLWLSRDENRIDVLIGNPPWLSYRYMPEPMQDAFRRFSQERGLWTGGAVGTHQDLSGLFVAICIERYLRAGGRFGFVVPYAVLSRGQFAGLRSGRWTSVREPATVAFDASWDFHLVQPSIFPVPCAVVFGTRTNDLASSLPEDVETWAGKCPAPGLSWDEASAMLTSSSGMTLSTSGGPQSPYQARFSQGATFVPRVLVCVERAPVGPLGAGEGRITVRSRRSTQEKEPWKSLPTLEGPIESQFVMRLHAGETVLPYRTRDPWLAVVPWGGAHLLSQDAEQIESYPGLRDWWQRAESLWMEHRSSSRMDLTAQLDYRRKLSDQFPVPEHRVVYTKSGVTLAAARISDRLAVIDHKLYWATAASVQEAHYLIAVLNSAPVTELVRPLQSHGAFGPRDFDKYVWQLPIPLFDSHSPEHVHIAELGRKAEETAATVELPDGRSFQTLRQVIREHLGSLGLDDAINEAVSSLLA